MTGEARRPPPPFDLVVLTGFLGAGKTTLLNQLLRDPALADTLVLINEFGEIGLDHLLVERVEGDMLVMASGCLCCSIRGDLVSALEDALRRRDNNRMSQFKRVIVETTGLADPAPVLHTIMTHPYLRMRFRLQAVVTVVDALVAEVSLDAQMEAVKQVAMADRLVVTKTDLVMDHGALATLKARLSRLNPGAPIFDAAAGEATGARLIEGLSYDPAARGTDAATWLAAEAVEAAQHHGHHHHDVNRHDEQIRAVCLRYPHPVPPMAVSLFLELLRSAHGPKLLRFKGLIALDDDPDRPLVAHGVQHVMHEPQRLTAWPDADHTTRMVFILRDLEPAFVEGLWKAAVGEPAVDRADRAALMNNPLAPAPGGLLA
ncbi:GTP-binding protein [Beijerinckia sp. L45]|uniref:CobW family GTP-binding protein n=1 Tax=Beijerinckia sp. L45 TaxID=1641855 RepID=UPI00131C3F19|nr:GTP-binding protein [Beijerinckia sp. L45]